MFSIVEPCDNCVYQAREENGVLKVSFACVDCRENDFYKNFKRKEDMVNHPEHYKTESGLETIDVIKAFTEDLNGIEAVCTANVIKYICRWKKKNGIEDLKKAEWYLKYLIKAIEK